MEPCTENKKILIDMGDNKILAAVIQCNQEKGHETMHSGILPVEGANHETKKNVILQTFWWEENL